jgi:hypothetical protein
MIQYSLLICALVERESQKKKKRFSKHQVGASRDRKPSLSFFFFLKDFLSSSCACVEPGRKKKRESRRRSSSAFIFLSVLPEMEGSSPFLLERMILSM